MKASLARRLFRTIFAIVLVSVVVTLLAVEFIYEDMEDTILRLELGDERAFLEARIAGAHIQEWRTALFSAVYVPDGAAWDDPPEMFAGRGVPFFEEIEIGERTFLISIDRSAHFPGVLYLSKDISHLEDREDVTQIGMALLGAGVLILGFLLARFGTHRVVGPLQTLARDIARIEPGTSLKRIESSYRDEELANIAATLNELLVALDAYVRREKSLVSLASHELRTPVAVIVGALDVLEQRASLGAADRRTVDRIRRAANEMRADVEALLKLARTGGGNEKATLVDLVDCVEGVITELENGDPRHVGRVTCRCTTPPLVRADPALLRMLLRNLIQNALRHTSGAIRVEIGNGHVSVVDSGEGLPDHILARLAEGKNSDVPDNGLGLFIVRLICERLDWDLRVARSDAGGTVVHLVFSQEDGIEEAPTV